jgi:preprotein translocase subunit SecD
MARRRVGLTIAGAVIAAAIVVIALSTGERRTGTGVAQTYELRGGDPRDVDRAVEVIRRRLDHASDVEPSVRQVGGRIEVELVGDRAATMAAIPMIAQPMALGIHLIDDGAEFWTRTFELSQTDRRPGIDAHTEPWPPIDDAPRRQGRADRFLLGRSRDDLATYLAKLHADPALAPPATRLVAYEQIQDFGKTGWRTHVIVRPPAVTGASVVRAEVGKDPDTRRPFVRLELDEAGREVFGKLTAAHVGDRIAIVLDGEVRTAAVLASAIPNGKVSITIGGNDRAAADAEAARLAAMLGAGALPAPLVMIDDRRFEVEIRDGVRWNVLAILGLAAVAFGIWMMTRRRT